MLSVKCVAPSLFPVVWYVLDYYRLINLMCMQLAWSTGHTFA